MKDNKPKTSFMDRAKLLIVDMHKALDKQPIEPDIDRDWARIAQEAEEALEDIDPYEKASWGDNWFCIRCGDKLHQVSKDDKVWADHCFPTMRKTGTLYYQCSNDKCFHHSAPLLLHHPIHGYRSPPGDSYSISWVK